MYCPSRCNRGRGSVAGLLRNKTLRKKRFKFLYFTGMVYTHAEIENINKLGRFVYTKK